MTLLTPTETTLCWPAAVLVHGCWAGSDDVLHHRFAASGGARCAHAFVHHTSALVYFRVFLAQNGVYFPRAGIPRRASLSVSLCFCCVVRSERGV
jgi:hypothetical protein